MGPVSFQPESDCCYPARVSDKVLVQTLAREAEVLTEPVFGQVLTEQGVSKQLKDLRA